jgi:hypothetical protein
VNLAELKAKTKVVAIGIVNQTNLYVSKEGKHYHSVDLLVKGMKNVLNLKLPMGYDVSKLGEGHLVEFNIEVTEFNGRTNLNVLMPEAVPLAK